jgi:hypothetical protein
MRSSRGKYRIRKAIRARLPWFLVHLGVAAKGKHDCGNHDWYKSSDEVDRCYYCDVGERRPSQIPRRPQSRGPEVPGRNL